MKSISHLILLLIYLFTTEAQSHQKSKLVIEPSGSIKRPINEKIALTCMGKGPHRDLFTNFKWFNPRNEQITENIDKIGTISIGNKLLLRFLKTTTDDSGEYKCTAEYQDGSIYEVKINVTFYISITWDDCPQSQFLIKTDQEQLIRCKVSANPSAGITWYKDGKRIQSKDGYIIDNDGVRIRRLISSNDAGNYRVVANVESTAELKDRLIQVEIYEKPRIIKISGSSIVILGERAELSCNAQGTPKPVFTWFDKQARNLSDDASYVVDRNSGILVINKVRKVEDNGTFECMAENNAGRDSKNIDVKVITRPVINSLLNVSDAVEDGNTQLECRYFGFPTPNVTFRRENQVESILPDGRIKFEKMNDAKKNELIYIMKINEVTKSDGGLYFCSATNEAGKVERTGHILVNYKPKFGHLPKIVKTWSNKPTNLTCIVDSVPNATVRWYRGLEEIQDRETAYRLFSDNFRGIYKLQVTPSRLNAYGKYNCRADNNYGFNITDIELRQVTEPNLPSVAIKKTMPTALNFSITYDKQENDIPIKKVEIQYKPVNDYSADYETLIYDWVEIIPENIHVVRRLRPKTDYIFRFRLKNDVGFGRYTIDKKFRTSDVTVPDPPQIYIPGAGDLITGEIVSEFSDEFTIVWAKPNDNGQEIDYYQVIYYKVNLNSNNNWQKFGGTITKNIDQSNELSYKIADLRDETFYKVEIRAHNSRGFSDPSLMVFKTSLNSPAVQRPESTVKANLSLTIFIIIAFIILMLLIMDIMSYFFCKVGVIYYIRSSLCGKSNETPNKKITTGGDNGDGCDLRNDELAPMISDAAGCGRLEERTTNGIDKKHTNPPKDSAV